MLLTFFLSIKGNTNFLILIVISQTKPAGTVNNNIWFGLKNITSIILWLDVEHKINDCRLLLTSATMKIQRGRECIVH